MGAHGVAARAEVLALREMVWTVPALWPGLPVLRETLSTGGATGADPPGGACVPEHGSGAAAARGTSEPLPSPLARVHK